MKNAATPYYTTDAVYRRSFGKVLNGSVAAVSLPPDVMAEANKEMQEAWDQYEETSLKNLTPRMCLRNASDVVYRVCTDVYHRRKDMSLERMLVDEDRLRGLGILLVSASLASMAVVLLY